MTDRLDALTALFRAMLASHLVFARGPGREQAMVEGAIELIQERRYGDAALILAELCYQAEESAEGLAAEVVECVRDGQYDTAAHLLEKLRMRRDE